MTLIMPASHPEQEFSFFEEMVFDREELLDRLDRDEELLREILASFMIDLPEIITAFNNALDSGDMQMIRAAAHKVKGAVANVSFKQLGELTRQIEYAARDLDTSKVDKLSRYLAPAVQAARGQIQQQLGPDANSAI